MTARIPVPTLKPRPLDVNINPLPFLNKNLGEFIVRPLNAFGLGGFVFDIEGETTMNLATEITDHFVETNVAVQDHIAIQPLRMTLRNYVGELVFRQDESTETVPQRLTQKLTVLNSFLPQLTQAVEQAKEIYREGLDGLGEFSLEQIPTAASRIVDLWALTKNLNPGASRQQQAYLYFKALMQEKILVSVQTPFEFVTNMAIESITATQGEESRFISNFTINLKQIRTVSTQVVPFNAANYGGRGGAQQQDTVVKGKTQGADANSSILFDIFTGVTN